MSILKIRKLWSKTLLAQDHVAKSGWVWTQNQCSFHHNPFSYITPCLLHCNLQHLAKLTQIIRVRESWAKYPGPFPLWRMNQKEPKISRDSHNPFYFPELSILNSAWPQEPTDITFSKPPIIFREGKETHNSSLLKKHIVKILISFLILMEVFGEYLFW